MEKTKNLEQQSREQGAGCVSGRRVWRPFLLWASVLGMDAKKNLRSCLLQQRLLTIRKERTGCKELVATEHTQRKNKENSVRERWAMPREANALEGWDPEFSSQDHLHNPGGSLIDSLD